jgi:hypothetical protein
MDKKSSETRSPLKDRPLRNPGQSVEAQRNDLLYDKFLAPVLMATMLVLLAGFEWWRYFFPSPATPYCFTFMAAVGIGYAAFLIMRAKPQLNALTQARDGEKVVGQFLDRLRENGFHIFHDLIGNDFNVDHVLVGPAGIFTVETKTFSKPARGNAKVTFDGETILVNGFRPDRNPVTQARAQANWLRNLVLESTGRKVAVRSVVLFPGWWVDPTPASLKPDVWVLEPKALPAFLAQERETLKPEDVNLISHHISRYVRTQSKAAS